MTGKLLALMLVVVACTPAMTASSGTGVAAPDAQPGGTAAAVATVAQFHELLTRGDSAGAVRLLASDALVLESGDRETRAEYIAQHLRADMEFATAVPSTRNVVDARREGDVVWVAATSVAKGTFRNRQINSVGAELMVLSRSAEGWLIRAIHWSSRRAGP